MSATPPTEFTVQCVREGEIKRALLVMNCDIGCTIPLWTRPCNDNAGAKQWQWDGNAERPTISPSIACTRCGWHKVITNGVA